MSSAVMDWPHWVPRRSSHFLDAVVAPVGDVEVAGRVERHAEGAVKQGRGGRAAVAGVARGARELPATV